MTKPIIADTEPKQVNLDAGEHYWCACGLSNNQPFCDGSHAGTGFSPKALGFHFFAQSNWLVAVYMFGVGGWLVCLGWGFIRRYRYAWYMFMLGSLLYLALVAIRQMSISGVVYGVALLAWGIWRAPIFGIRLPRLSHAP